MTLTDAINKDILYKDANDTKHIQEAQLSPGTASQRHIILKFQ